MINYDVIMYDFTFLFDTTSDSKNIINIKPYGVSNVKK